MKKTYFVQYSESSSGGEVCAGQENDSWPSYETEYIQFNPEFIATDRDLLKHYIVEQMESDELGSQGYLLVARYATGCTFTHIEGRYDFLGLFPSEIEANEFSKTVNQNRWTDYFGGFEGFEVYALEVVR